MSSALANPSGSPTVYQVPAGVRVVAIHEKGATQSTIWGRWVKPARTSRLNTFTAEDLVEVRPTGYLFRLQPNSKGLALLMVPAEFVIERKD